MKKRIFNHWFGLVDMRPVAMFRIFFALILLKDAIYHLPIARIFYSDEGILPRYALFDGIARQQRFSLMDAISHEWMAHVFFGFWIIVILALLVGWQTRWMTILNFLLILSVHERNTQLLTGADTLMRVLSFWLMFLPAGLYYSVDALRQKEPVRMGFALPLRLIQWQLAIVYISTAFLKLYGTAWQEGTVLFYISQMQTVLLPVGQLLALLPEWALKAGTYFAFGAEILIPIYLLMPFWQPAGRMVAFALACLLHGGIALVLAIPDFSWVILTAFLVFFEPSWCFQLENRFSTLSGWVSRQRWAQLVGAFILKILPPSPTHSLPSRRVRIVLAGGLIPLMVVVIFWNIWATTDYLPIEVEPPIGESIMWYSGLWQYWDLFSPMPIQYDGWIVIEGSFENSLRFDLFTNRAIDYDTPTMWLWGPQMRWEKYEDNAFRYQDEAVLSAWASSYCHEYNVEQASVRGTRLAIIQIQFVHREFHAPDEPPNPQHIQTIWYHWCLDEYAPG